MQLLYIPSASLGGAMAELVSFLATILASLIIVLAVIIYFTMPHLAMGIVGLGILGACYWLVKKIVLEYAVTAGIYAKVEIDKAQARAMNVSSDIALMKADSDRINAMRPEIVKLEHVIHIVPFNAVEGTKSNYPISTEDRQLVIELKHQAIAKLQQQQLLLPPPPQVRKPFFIDGYVRSLIASPTQNLRLTGPTQRGKTTLAMNILAEIIKPLSTAEIYVIDPKFLENHGPDKWGNLQVLVRDIDNALTALEWVYDEVFKQRLKSKNTHPIFVIIDEVDWLYEVYKKDFISLVSKFAKIGSEMSFYIFIMGQSPLVKDSGLSTSLTDNFNCIHLGKAAKKFVRSPEFPHDKTTRQLYMQDLNALECETAYYGVSQVVGQDWFSFPTPPLTKPNITTTVEIENRPSIFSLPVADGLTEEERKVIELRDIKKLSWNKIALEIVGSEGGWQSSKCQTLYDDAKKKCV